MVDAIVRFFLVSFALASAVHADSLSFDFDTGVGPQFTVVNEGGLWDVRSQGGELRVWKGADPGGPDAGVEEAQFVRGGVRSRFELAGDFEVTVDFTIYDFTPLPAPGGLTESILGVSSVSDPLNLFWVLRFNDRAEGFVQYPQAPIGARYAPDLSGTYRITRYGTTLGAWYRAAGSPTLELLGSTGGVSGPVAVDLLGRQGYPYFYSPGPRSALDIGFDNLRIEAESIVGVVPEPGSLVLAGMGLLAAGCYLRRRVRLRDHWPKSADGPRSNATSSRRPKPES